MSKESKPRDLWRQVFEAAQDRPDTWCKGCGYYPVVHDGTHRADCYFVIGPRCSCGEILTRSESIAAKRCLECRLIETQQADERDRLTSVCFVASVNNSTVLKNREKATPMNRHQRRAKARDPHSVQRIRDLQDRVEHTGQIGIITGLSDACRDCGADGELTLLPGGLIISEIFHD